MAVMPDTPIVAAQAVQIAKLQNTSDMASAVQQETAAAAAAANDPVLTDLADNVKPHSNM